jgi:hypothetical protein
MRETFMSGSTRGEWAASSRARPLSYSTGFYRLTTSSINYYQFTNRRVGQTTPNSALPAAGVSETVARRRPELADSRRRARQRAAEQRARARSHHAALAFLRGWLAQGETLRFGIGARPSRRALPCASRPKRHSHIPAVGSFRICCRPGTFVKALGMATPPVRRLLRNRRTQKIWQAYNCALAFRL